VPAEWEESDPKYITNSAEVKLRSFTTKASTAVFVCQDGCDRSLRCAWLFSDNLHMQVHKVDAMVAYKQDDPF
jgi:hypothetical protein